MISIGVFGASGYSGLELLAILARHPAARVVFATSERFVGKACVELNVSAPERLGFVSQAEGLARAAECDVVFLATPAEASRELVDKLGQTRVIDLSNAFRFDGQSLYGLLPCFAESRPAARIIANPGCYATAGILALAPFFADKLIEPEVIIDAASGTTGAGRRASEDYSFSELHDDLFAYKVLTHQHTPEMAAAYARLGGQAVDVTFTAKLLPVRRGILASAYARLRQGVGAEQAHAAFASYYEGAPFVRLAPRAEDVRLRRVVGSNDVLMHAAIDARTGRVVVLSALDNLLKGAAGQAVENMNLAFSLDQKSGLDSLRVH